MARGMLGMLGSAVMLKLHLFNSSLVYFTSLGNMFAMYLRHHMHHIRAQQLQASPAFIAAVVLAVLAAVEFAAVTYHHVVSGCAAVRIMLLRSPG